MAWANSPKDPRRNNTGFRINETGSAANYQPYILWGPGNDDTEPELYKTNEWAVDKSGATTNSQYHQFSCSKCHNPHASRLPKLMITNCLDTKHNTWDGPFQMGGANMGGRTFSGTVNNNVELANLTSAQNCHRYGARATNNTNDPYDGDNEFRSGAVDGTGSGWNTVTPWKR